MMQLPFELKYHLFLDIFLLFDTVRSYFCMFFGEYWVELYTIAGWNYNEMA